MNLELIDNYGHYIVPDDCRGGIAIDIGCNNGGFLSRYCNFFDKITAFEPNINLFNLLNEKYKDNEKISINNKAVWSHDGVKLNLLKCLVNDDNGSYAIEKELAINVWDKDNIICSIDTISLDTILHLTNYHVDYMKIDCETSEYEFLLNKNLSNIKYIGIELHAQLGFDKYKELYEYISITHCCNQSLSYRQERHQEVLFTIK